MAAPAPKQRTSRMAALYRSGKTLQEIGELYGGLTRERIRQVLEKAGVKLRRCGPPKRA